MKILIAIEDFMNKMIERALGFFISLIPMRVRTFPETILLKLNQLKAPKVKIQKPNFSIPKIDKAIWIKNLNLKISKMKPERVLTVVALSSILSIGTVTIYHNSKRIYEIETASTTDRTPASIMEVKEKKAYHNLTKKMISIEGLKVPALVEDMHSINNITLDFSVTSNNRFTTLYLNNHREEVKDYIIMRFEPILSSFVIQEEGKEVIKERIRFLLNDYLSEAGVDGKIENVQILYLMGT